MLASFLWLESEYSSSFRNKAKQTLRKELTRMDLQSDVKTADMLYVLGGSENILVYRFKMAASFFRDGKCKKIYFLSRPGKTRFSSLLGRNMTNDEWSKIMLEKFGVPKNNSEVLSIEEKYFGTLREAKYIANLTNKKGFNNLVLVTSATHTHRVKICFKKFLKKKVKLYVIGSEDNAYLRDLIKEYIKLNIYKYFLLF